MSIAVRFSFDDRRSRSDGLESRESDVFQAIEAGNPCFLVYDGLATSGIPDYLIPGRFGNQGSGNSSETHSGLDRTSCGLPWSGPPFSVILGDQLVRKCLNEFLNGFFTAEFEFSVTIGRTVTQSVCL